MIKHSWLNWRKLIVDDRDLSFGAKSIALYLNTYMNDSHDMAFPSIATIRGELNIGSNSTAIKYLDELEGKGYLQRQKRYNNTTIYHAIVPLSITNYVIPPVLQNMNHSITESTPTVLQNLEPNKQMNKQSNKQVFPKKIDFSGKDGYTALFIENTLLDMNPKMKQQNIDLWSNTIRLMRERDKRTHDEIKELFLWANNDDFWHQNILSPEKLRKQWDTLVIQRKAKLNGGRNLKLPQIDENLYSFAEKNNLPKAMPGESYPQYRSRLNSELEKRIN